MTDAQSAALKWLFDHNGDGLFDNFGVVVAGGEAAPVHRSTWNKLSELGFVEFYGGHRDGKKCRGRLRLTAAGQWKGERMTAQINPDRPLHEDIGERIYWRWAHELDAGAAYLRTLGFPDATITEELPKAEQHARMLLLAADPARLRYAIG